MGKYKFVGPGKHHYNNQPLQVGEIVDIDDNQFVAANLADRFVKAEDSKGDELMGKAAVLGGSGGVRLVGGGGVSGNEVLPVPPDPTRFTYSEISDSRVNVSTSESDSEGESDGASTGLISDEDLLNQDKQVSSSDYPTQSPNDDLDEISTMTVPQVKSLIASADSRAEVRAILDYEQSHLQRSGVVNAAEARLQQMGK